MILEGSVAKLSPVDTATWISPAFFDLPCAKSSSVAPFLLFVSVKAEIPNLRVLINEASYIVDLIVDHKVQILLAGVASNLSVSEFFRHLDRLV